MLDSASGLSARDLVSLWVGRAVRQDVALESTVRMIWERLASGGMAGSIAWAAMPRNFGPMLDDCFSMVNASGFEEDHKSAALACLRMVKAAHEGRSSSVHKRWDPVEHQGDELLYRAGSLGIEHVTPPEVQWTLAEFETIFGELVRANIAAIAMLFSLSATSERGPERGLVDRAMMRGRFIITDVSDDGSCTYDHTDVEVLAAIDTILDRIHEGFDPTAG